MLYNKKTQLIIWWYRNLSLILLLQILALLMPIRIKTCQETFSVCFDTLDSIILMFARLNPTPLAGE